MDSFIFAINATMPVFLVMAVGWLLRKWKLLNKPFCDVADKLVFKVALPVLLFNEISTSELHQNFDISFVLFCMIGTTIIFFAVWFLARIFIKDTSLVGAFSQAAARGSAAILGIAFVENIYGSAGMTPLMIVSAVPLFNIYSVIILTFSAESDVHGSAQIKKAVINVIKNPIIIGIVLGLPFSIFRVQFPVIITKTITSISNIATPLALLTVGATFEGRAAIKKLKPTFAATVIKLIILPMIFLPLAVLFGFRGSELVAILIMVGSPTTVSCYIMAKNMGNDPILSSSIIVSATIFSSVTLTSWIFLLRFFSYI